MTLIKTCPTHKTMYYRECRECLHEINKAGKQMDKEMAKRNRLIAKQKEASKQPRAKVSKNPKDWNNTFLCSDGTKVTQTQINNRLTRAYRLSSYSEQFYCEGCGKPAEGHAHIIAKARCKKINKTELIWNPKNYFTACHRCNSAIENPKNSEWKYMLNIDRCLDFIQEHDPQLYTKFEQSFLNQDKEPTI